MLLDRFRLDGKVALITGGGRGLGRAIAEAYAEVGAETVIVGRTDSDLKAAARVIERHGRRCVPLPADIASPPQREAMFDEALARCNRIDVLVNAAAIGWPGQQTNAAPRGKPFLETTPVDWEAVMTLNLDVTAAMIKLAAEQMIRLGCGKIINLTTAGGRHAADGFSAHGATKAAIEHLTRTLAHELGPRGIHINCIAPGRVVTREQEAGGYWTAARRAGTGQSIAIGRVGEEDDITPLALYLASEASDFVTGATFDVDGGGYLLRAVETAP